MVFPHAKGGSVTEAPHYWNFSKGLDKYFGHHDRGLCLVYILEHGIYDGWWEQVYQFDDTISMWSKNAVEKEESLIYLNTNIDNTISVDGINTDIITIRTNSGNDWATAAVLNVNGISLNIDLPFVPARFDKVYATDINANDGYRNIIIELISEFDTSRTYAFCYNNDSIQQVEVVEGSLDVSYKPENGTFYTWCFAGFGNREIGPASYRREYYIDGLSLIEVGSSVGYYTDVGFKGEYVDGYPVTLGTTLSI